jgi:hypothetical protein
MTLIDTRTEATQGRSRSGRRPVRRFRLLRALEDLARGRVGLLYLPGAPTDPSRGRRDGRR